MIKFNLIFILIIIVSINGCIGPSEPSSGISDGGYKIVSKFSVKGYAQDVTIKDTLALIAQGEGGLEIININNPIEPTWLSTAYQELRGYSRKITYYENSVYIAAGAFGPAVVNINDSKHPEIVETNLEMKPARNLYIYKNFLFAAISEQGVKIADLVVPDHPDIKGRIMDTPGYTQGLTVYKDSLLLIACGEMGIAIYDISKMQTGFETFVKGGWIDLEGYSQDITVSQDKPIAYIATGLFGLQIIDFSDISNIKLIGSYDIGGYAREVAVKGDIVYMATQTRGMQIISVENNSNSSNILPELIGVVETEYAMGLEVTDDYVYIADEHEGLIIVSIPK